MSNTTIQKCRASRYYSRISNSVLQDPRLTLKARGLIGYILSLPDNWTISIAHLSTISPDKEFSIRSAMDELKRFGYMSNEKIRDQAGRIIESRWTAYDDPDENLDFRKSLEINPRSGFPHVGNQGLQKKHTITTKETVGPQGPPEDRDRSSEQPRCASLLPAGDEKGAKAPLEPAKAGPAAPSKNLKDKEASNGDGLKARGRIDASPEGMLRKSKVPRADPPLPPVRLSASETLRRDLCVELKRLCDDGWLKEGDSEFAILGWAINEIRGTYPTLTPCDLRFLEKGYRKLFPEAALTPAALAKWHQHSYNEMNRI